MVDLDQLYGILGRTRSVRMSTDKSTMGISEAISPVYMPDDQPEAGVAVL